MRTILLREFKPTLVALNGPELDELLAVGRGLVEVASRGGGKFTLRARSRVGTVITKSLRLLIRPKVELRNVFFLLGYSTNVRWSEGLFPYDEDDFLNVVARWFDREVVRAARFGVVRAYVEREETLVTIRGRIAIDRQLATRPGLAFPIECRYQEYSEDSPLNQLIRAAHVALLRLPGLSQDIASGLRHRLRTVFGGVTTVEFAPSAVPNLTFTRLDRHWQPVATLARLILRQRSIRDEEGAVSATAFTIDMNRLFEQFIEVVVREVVAETGISLIPQAQRRLTGAGITSNGVVVPPVNTRPDLLLVKDGVPVAVGDAKYKHLLRLGDWEHPDLYQLLAYCVRFGLQKGLLIYADSRPPITSKVIGAETELTTIGVDLRGKPEQVLASARSAAATLLGQARGAPIAA